MWRPKLNGKTPAFTSNISARDITRASCGAALSNGCGASRYRTRGGVKGATTLNIGYRLPQTTCYLLRQLQTRCNGGWWHSGAQNILFDGAALRSSALRRATVRVRHRGMGRKLSSATTAVISASVWRRLASRAAARSRPGILRLTGYRDLQPVRRGATLRRKHQRKSVRLRLGSGARLMGSWVEHERRGISDSATWMAAGGGRGSRILSKRGEAMPQEGWAW